MYIIMPPRGKKRSPAPEPLEAGPPTKLQKVSMALRKLDSYPAAAAEMLLAGLPHVSGSTRHPWQEEVISMAKEALEEGRGQAKQLSDKRMADVAKALNR